jgi:hypothetical protein
MLWNTNFVPRGIIFVGPPTFFYNTNNSGKNYKFFPLRFINPCGPIAIPSILTLKKLRFIQSLSEKMRICVFMLLCVISCIGSCKQEQLGWDSETHSEKNEIQKRGRFKLNSKKTTFLVAKGTTSMLSKGLRKRFKKEKGIFSTKENSFDLIVKWEKWN